MRIAIIAQPWDKIEVPFHEGSTISIVARNLAAALPPGHEIFVVAGRGATQPHREVTNQGVTVVRFSSPGKSIYKLLDRLTGFFDMNPPFFTSRWYYHRFQRKVERFLHNISPDFVLVFTFFQFVPLIRRVLPEARIALRMSGASLGMMDPKIAGSQLDAVDIILGNSDHTTQLIRANLPSIAHKCHTMYNGVDSDLFVPIKPRRSQAIRNKVILFVGRISPEKGVHVLLEAFSEVLNQHPDCELRLVGAPGLLPYSYHFGLSQDAIERSCVRFYGQTLRAKIDRQLLDKDESYLNDLKKILNPHTISKVKFLGPMAYSKLPDIYSDASVFVAPSVIQEPFGNPVAEAMACELPVVATRGGGFRELIEDNRSGILVERNNADQLGKALCWFLSNPDAAAEMGSEARKRIVSRFTWHHSSDSLLEHALASDR
jgi:glycosyltransferase involved in cell wall biosynthesis